MFLLLILGTFLLASVGFAVDLSSMWFHRQAAQSAADAACVAGAMDMLYLQQGHHHQQSWLYRRHRRGLLFILHRRAVPICSIQWLHCDHLCCRMGREHIRRRGRGQLDFPQFGHRRYRRFRRHLPVSQCRGAGKTGYLVYGSC